MSSINFADLAEGKAKRIEVDGAPVCVARIGDEVFAIGDTCSHSDASLAEGDISGYKIECWLHGAEFDLRTGAALTPPATTAVPTYSVHRDGDTVTISASKEA
jgi:3-phenylpropionate/trans-cinnamate dioxygenase ferredoxin subunit